MSARDQLNAYVDLIERRLRLGALLRGGAILTSVALTVTVVLVLISNALAFSSWSLTTARVALILALAFAAGFGLAVPLYGLDRKRASSKAEKAFPKFEQRLITFAERDSAGRDPFLELLAGDTLSVARDAEPKRLITDGALFASLCAGVASLAVLIWLIVAGPGYLGHGAALLWVGAPKDAAPMYDIRVSPGDAAVRRNTDQLVTAQLVGLQTDRVRLYARYQSTSKWEEVSMQPQQGASGFQFLFAGLPEGVEYYVEAGPLHSKHFSLRVVDLPAVKQIKVTYHYPSWTGMAAAVEEHGGDLRAVEGTEADLQIVTDRPLKDGVLALDDQQLNLSSGQNNVYTGTVKMQKDGLYHVAALDQGQSVRLSGDYFIEASKANPPEVHITRPGRDYRSSPIEEVTVAASASDEFGLGDVTIHYSVNGGPEKDVSLLKQKGQKQADGSTMIALEDYKLVPGDLVSFYATAKDAHAEAHTDMFFIQADPYEREFSQSQQAGGGGGGAGGGGGQGDQTEISEREKQIIAATWNQQTNMNATKQESAETAKFLSGVQSKLRDQALSLAGRLEARELTEQNQEFSDFQKDMNAAAAEMSPAADKLQALKWSDAIPSEQKALQHLLRAEATFRQIEVAFGSRGGGGGGAGGAGRDLSSLFDLELDTEKNQYEAGQTASSDSQRAQEIDQALQKLQELARRQQELAEQQQNSSKQNADQQRWEQEMLRRDAEELQKQMEQMARDQQGQQGQQGQSGQSGSPSNSSSASSSGASGAQGSAASRAQQALDRLREANDDMRRAASQNQPGQQGQNDADARRAADRLREASDLLGGLHQQQASGQVDELSREAQRLSSEQRAEADRMRGAFGQSGQSAQNGQPGQNGARQSAQGGGQTAAERQEQAKLGDDRQRMAGDLAQLEKKMQDAERALGSTQRDAASKLRDALGGLDESSLKDKLSRSADEIRRGVDPSSGEPAIGAGLQHLDDQLRQAQQAMGGGQQPGNDNSQEALNRVERLRNQMEVLSRAGNGNAGANGGKPGQGGQQGQGARNGNGGGQGAQGGALGNGNAGAFGGGQYGGGFQGGGRYGYGDTGSYTSPTGTERQPAPVTQADIERAYQNAMQELNDLQHTVQGQPEPLADITELLHEMQQLDPKRFPGNPAMLEELHGRVLASVDQLELKLRQDVDDKQAGQVRAGDSLPVPAGYQDAVAEYFRRLSKTQ